MSPKKITDADKLEIIDLYRQTGDTTASLANRYGVSNSTISRLLKTSIPEAEYDLLIQQKRGSKVVNEGDGLATIDEPITLTSTKLELNHESVKSQPQLELQLPAIAAVGLSEPELATDVEDEMSDSQTLDRQIQGSTQVKSTFSLPDLVGKVSPVENRNMTRPISTPTEDSIGSKRLVRRRSSAADRAMVPANSPDLSAVVTPALESVAEPKTLDRSTTTIQLPVPRQPALRDVPATSVENYLSDVAEPVSSIQVPTDELEEDDSKQDVNVLAAMFGEEIADGDDDDFTEDEDWEEEATSIDRDRLLTPERSHLQVIPLSQATLPRTCYIVIDKFAELIVRPLKDFAELGQIPGEEIQQRTLPIFDNHRVAKRFSNQRTQRVIKVPDSQVFYKTIQHLRSKGIARLLVDGNIYSLN
jgi:transposase-like protein